jgi:hypothetical protein
MLKSTMRGGLPRSDSVEAQVPDIAGEVIELLAMA